MDLDSFILLVISLNIWTYVVNLLLFKGKHKVANYLIIYIIGSHWTKLFFTKPKTTSININVLKTYFQHAFFNMDKSWTFWTWKPIIICIWIPMLNQLVRHHSQVSHPQEHWVPFVMTQTTYVTCNLEGWWAPSLHPIFPKTPQFCWWRFVSRS
jgi:hypothetical protein